MIVLTPVESVKAMHTAKAFVSTWVRRFGIPIRITTDRGSAFTAKAFKAAMKILDITSEVCAV